MRQGYISKKTLWPREWERGEYGCSEKNKNYSFVDNIFLDFTKNNNEYIPLY